MTRTTTPVFIALLPLMITACQDDTANSDPTLDGLVFMDDSVDINTAGSDGTGLSLESAEGGLTLSSPFSGAGEDEPVVGPEEDLTPASATLQCATAAFHYDFSGVPKSVRMDLSLNDDEIAFAYQDTAVHLDAAHGVGMTPVEFAGTASGEWTDTMLSLFVEQNDGDRRSYFGMDLFRDERTSGTVYTGTAYVEGCFGVEMTCWDPEIEPEFLYDSETGTCTSDDGVAGMNPWPIHMVRETGDGECADLSDTMLNEEDYGYPSLELWNLRGANLEGATLHFASLVGADLEGTDMSDLEYGYAVISGTTDEYTQLPSFGCSEGYGIDLYCWN